MNRKVDTHFRVDEADLARLKRLARLRSLEEGRDVTWCDLLRRALADFLDALDQTKGTKQ